LAKGTKAEELYQILKEKYASSNLKYVVLIGWDLPIPTISAWDETIYSIQPFQSLSFDVTNEDDGFGNPRNSLSEVVVAVIRPENRDQMISYFNRLIAFYRGDKNYNKKVLIANAMDTSESRLIKEDYINERYLDSDIDYLGGITDYENSSEAREWQEKYQSFLSESYEFLIINAHGSSTSHYPHAGYNEADYINSDFIKKAKPDVLFTMSFSCNIGNFMTAGSPLVSYVFDGDSLVSLGSEMIFMDSGGYAAKGIYNRIVKDSKSISEAARVNGYSFVFIGDPFLKIPSTYPNSQPASIDAPSPATTLENTPITLYDSATATRLSGRLLLATEDHGRVYYVNPADLKKYEITTSNMMDVFSSLATGISNTDLNKIPINPDSVSASVDSDGDGYSDKSEVTYGYNPYLASDPAHRGNDKMTFDYTFANNQKGRLLLQVEDRGRIWYVDFSAKRWQITWDNAMTIFTKLSLGITNADLAKIPSADTTQQTVSICESYEVCDGAIISSSGRHCLGQCKLPKSFDWRNRHGENWNTSVKNQGGAGTCHSFARVGAFEAQANLYFNQHLNLDLSEQIDEDCSITDFVGEGTTCRSAEGYNLNYCKTQKFGLPDESCDPYVERPASGSDNCSLSNICSDWTSRVWKNSSTIYYDVHPEDNTDYDFPGKISASYPYDIQRYLITNGPMSAGLVGWDHQMTLVGYETDINKEIVWIFKNSWGTDIGEGGYIKSKASTINLGSVGYATEFMSPEQPQGPFIPPTDHSYWPVNFNNQISCIDKDNDGFCNWGISENKPTTCPASCKSEKDWDDSDPNIGAIGIY